MKLIITGSAGFIGYSLSKRLLENNLEIIGIDNHNNYYDTKLKEARFNKLIKHSNYQHYRIDLSDQDSLKKIFKENKPDVVINLAAQAGVRYSLEKPQKYIDSNIIGYFNILDLSKKYNVKHFVYASTSSVYGLDKKFPLSEEIGSSHPIQLYAATKRANELFAHAYSSLFNLPTTGLRFFTVYGPWGRPDMALFKFTKNILEGKKIELFNKGDHIRDFTYIDDIVDGIVKACFKKKKHKYRIYNLGSGKKIALTKLINTIQSKLGLKAKINLKKMQKGDVKNTLSDLTRSKKELNYNPRVKIEEGIDRYIKWYRKYYNI